MGRKGMVLSQFPIIRLHRHDPREFAAVDWKASIAEYVQSLCRHSLPTCKCGLRLFVVAKKLTKCHAPDAQAYAYTRHFARDVALRYCTITVMLVLCVNVVEPEVNVPDTASM